MSQGGNALEEAITKGLADAGLEESLRGTVRALLEQDDDRWRDCCGSNCTPCVTQLAIAVDRARELIAQ